MACLRDSWRTSLPASRPHRNPSRVLRPESVSLVPRLAGPPSGLGTGPGGELPGGVVEDHAAFGDPRFLARAQAGGLADREGAPLRAAEAVHGIVNLHGLGPRSHARTLSERRT